MLGHKFLLFIKSIKGFIKRRISGNATFFLSRDKPFRKKKRLTATAFAIGVSSMKKFMLCLLTSFLTLAGFAQKDPFVGFYQGEIAGAKGYPLGWCKVSGGVAKNHYPKGLRRTTAHEFLARAAH